MQSDQFLDLIQQVKAGDTRRFLEVIEPFYPHLKRLSRCMLPNAADAEEVVQETILKALQHIDQLRDVQCFKGWLFQIAVNEARLRMRGNRRFGTEPEAELSEEAEDSGSTSALDRVPDKGALPLEIVQRKELWVAAKRSIHALKPSYREVFVLRDLQGIGVTETAAILSISEASVHIRLHRARRHMRKLMEPYLRTAGARWKPLQMGLDMVRRYKNRVIGCRKVLDALSNYIDGTICDQLRREVEAHLKYCSRCMLMLDMQKQVMYLVADERMFDHAFECKNRWEYVREAFSQGRV